MFIPIANLLMLGVLIKLADRFKKWLVPALVYAVVKAAASVASAFMLKLQGAEVVLVGAFSLVAAFFLGGAIAWLWLKYPGRTWMFAAVTLIAIVTFLV